MLQSPFIERERISSVMQENADKKGFTFWWTIWTKKEALENKEKISAGDRNIEIAKWTATEKEFHISEGEPAEIRIALFYHPNWKAFVDGKSSETKPDENGAILLSIPPENSDVKIVFYETRAVQTGRWISAAFWLCLLIFGLFKSVKSFQFFRQNRKTSA
jgi:hypothetical protein